MSSSEHDRLKRVTIETYNREAGKDEQKFARRLQDDRPEFKMFASRLPGRRILDVGSGPGLHALRFENMGLVPTCIDLSKEMIRRCKKRGLTSYVMDMEHLAFPPASFDGIWAVTSLIHVKKDRVHSVLTSFHNLLIPKGILFVSLKDGEGESFDEPRQKFYAYWTEEEFLRLTKPLFDKQESWIVAKDGQRYLNIFFKKK